MTNKLFAQNWDSVVLCSASNYCSNMSNNCKNIEVANISEEVVHAFFVAVLKKMPSDLIFVNQCLHLNPFAQKKVRNKN